MSDLSLPVLNLVPIDEPTGLVPSQDRTGYEGFKWPTPPFASYPEAQRQAQPEPCEIEGLNGNVMTGKLMSFSPEAGAAHVQVPPTRGALPLRFAQFRRLTL